jgi:hypothetical protein
VTDVQNGCVVNFIGSSSENDEASCSGVPIAKSSDKLSLTSGASKRRKRREASKHVQKLSAYFRPIYSALQSKETVQTVQCTECEITRTSSDLHDTCSTAASDHSVGGGFDCPLEVKIDIGSETAIEPASSLLSSSTINLPSNTGVDTSCTAADIPEDDGSSSSHGITVDQYQTVLDQLLHEPNPTDRGHFPVNITGDNATVLKTFIVEHGSCRPPVLFLELLIQGGNTIGVSARHITKHVTKQVLKSLSSGCAIHQN